MPCDRDTVAAQRKEEIDLEWHSPAAFVENAHLRALHQGYLQQSSLREVPAMQRLLRVRSGVVGTGFVHRKCAVGVS
jgi:hypothetical protein